jgi:urea transport system ATP-binding protein
MLTLQSVDGFYGRSQILHDLSLEASKGQIVAILGRNGVGKTTLMKSIMGLTVRTAGSIRLGDIELTNTPTFERARAGIAYVPQGREIIPDFTVRENILMGAFARPGVPRRVPDLVVELFPYLRDNMNKPGGLLSGGQQQQLAIARALAAEPKVLLLDEPTEGIQPNIVELIEDAIRKLNRALGLTILLVEQNVAFARSSAHSFAMMVKGSVVASGPVAELSDAVVGKHMM